MHIEILEQIATIEPQFNPDHFNRTTTNPTPVNLNEPFYPSFHKDFSKEEYVYFLEPEIKNIVTVIRNISFAGDIVVLNSDVEYLGQIRNYLEKPTTLKAAFIITMNEVGKLQFWKINLEETGHVLSSNPIPEFSKWTIEAHNLTYDCSSLKGKCSTGETTQNDNKPANQVPTISLQPIPIKQRRQTQNAFFENQLKSINSTTLACLIGRFKRTMLHSNPDPL